LKNTTFVLNCPSQERTPLYKAIFYIVYIYFGDYFLPYFSISQDKLKLNGHSVQYRVQITGPSISLHDIHILHRGDSQTPTGHLVKL